MQRAEAEQITEAFERCSPAWKLLLINSVTEGADEIGAEPARCVSSELSDDDARKILIGELDRAYDVPSQPDAQSFPELVEPLSAAFDACLTPAELNGLDFN